MFWKKGEKSGIFLSSKYLRVYLLRVRMTLGVSLSCSCKDLPRLFLVPDWQAALAGLDPEPAGLEPGQ